MKRLLAILLALLPVQAIAQVAISQLPSATTLSGTEATPVVQSSTNKKTTAAQIQQSGMQTTNTVLAAPNGSSGAPSFRALVSADITGPITLTGPSGFWTNDNPFPGSTLPVGEVHRITNRVQFGAATVESGDFCFPTRVGCTTYGATTKDWYETFEATRSNAYGFRTSWAQVAALSPNGGIALMGAARTSDATDPTLAGFQLGMGSLSACINDNTTLQQLCTAGYDVAFRLPGAGQTLAGTGTVGREVDIANEGNLVQIYPNNLYPTTGFTTALQVNSGAVDPYAVSASAAVSIGNNGSSFLSGITFGQNSLAGLTYDGTGKALSGNASAMRYGAFQQEEWYVGSSTTPSFVIVSQQHTPANVQAIVAKDTGIDIGGTAPLAGLAIRALYPQATTGAYLQVTPAYNANPLTISAAGQTNATMAIQSAGTGVIAFTTTNVTMNGTAAASCAAGTVNAATMVVTNGIVTHC